MSGSQKQVKVKIPADFRISRHFLCCGKAPIREISRPRSGLFPATDETREPAPGALSTDSMDRSRLGGHSQKSPMVHRASAGALAGVGISFAPAGAASVGPAAAWPAGGVARVGSAL